MVVGAKWAHLGSSETVDGLRFSHTTSVQRYLMKLKVTVNEYKRAFSLMCHFCVSGEINIY